jgi:hypothetical protein
MKRLQVLLICLLLLSLVPAAPAADTGGDWSTEWFVSLDRPTPSDNYAVRVDLTPTVFDYTGAQAMGRDIRFMGKDRQSLSYWAESWDPNAGSVLWVNVPDAGTSSFAMLSGNPQAGPESSGETTFLFFDDFSGPALDTGRWYEAGNGNVTIKNGVLNSVGKKALFSKDAIPSIYDKVLEVRGKFHGYSGNDVDIGFGRITGPNLWVDEAQGEWINAHGWEGTGMTLKNAGDAKECYQALYPATPLWDSSGSHTYSLAFEPGALTVTKDYQPYITYNTTGCRLAADTLPVELVLDHSEESPDYLQTLDWVRVRSSGPAEPRAVISRTGTAPVPAPKTGAGQFPYLSVLLILALLIIAGYVVLSRRGMLGTHRIPASAIPRPAISMTKEVAIGYVGGIELEIANPGPAAITGIRITVNPPADIKHETTVHELAGLEPAESRVVPVTFFPPSRGMYVMKVEVDYEVWGLKHHLEFAEHVKVK